MDENPSTAWTGTCGFRMLPTDDFAQGPSTARLTEVACLDCLATVGVKKNSEHHTSIQWHADSLAQCAEFRRMEGEPGGRHVYASCPRLTSSIDRAVAEGELEIVRELAGGGEELVTVAVPGEYFGEIGPLFHLPRSATVRARTDATVIGYTVLAFRERIAPRCQER